MKWFNPKKAPIPPKNPNEVNNKGPFLNNTIGPKLVSAIGYPITSSSVNRHGNKPMNNPKEIIDEFGDEVDIIINAGVLATSSGSTIYMLRNNQFQIIRR